MPTERASWNMEKERFFTTRLVDELRSGRGTDNGFKGDTFSRICTEFNQRFGTSISTAQLRSHFQQVVMSFTSRVID